MFTSNENHFYKLRENKKSRNVAEEMEEDLALTNDAWKRTTTKGHYNIHDRCKWRRIAAMSSSAEVTGKSPERHTVVENTVRRVYL